MPPPGDKVSSPKKRQRVSRACDSCRRKKIKCDGVQPTCNNCKNVGECVYTINEKKPVKRKRATNIVKLESRLDRIESMLEALIPATGKRTKRRKDESEDEEEHDGYEDDEEENDEVEDDGDGDEGEDNITKDNNVNNNSNSKSKSKSNTNNTNTQDDDPENYASSHSDFTPNDWRVQDLDVPEGGIMLNFKPLLKINRKSDMYTRSIARANPLFCGPGPTFSVLSSSGIKWIGEKIDDKKLTDRLTDPFMEIFSDQVEKIRPLVEPLSQPYPFHRDVLEACIEAFLGGPGFWKFIINSDEIDEIVQNEYSEDDSQLPNGYAEHFVLNAIMTIALPFAYKIPHLKETVLKDLKSNQNIDTTVQKLFANCLFYARRIALIHPNLTSIKALLLLMVALECSNSPHPIAYIISITCHLASEMGLSRKESCSGLTKEEANRRKSLFWMLYVFDHDAAMKACRSAKISDCDVTIEMPDYDKDDYRYGDSSYLKLLVTFFHLSSDCYVRLFSPKATTKRPIDIVRDVQYCDEQLEKWKNNIPSEYMPGCSLDYFSIDDPSHEAVNKEFHRKVGILYMHYLYYQLLSSIHRTVAYHPSWVYLLVEEEKEKAKMMKVKSNGSNHSTPRTSSGGIPQPSIATSNNINNSNPNTNTNQTSTSTPTSRPNSISSGIDANETPYSSPKNGNLSVDQSPIIALHYKYPRLFSSLDICNHSARRTIELIQRTKSWGQFFLWGSIYFATNSFIALFVKCLAKPLDSTTRLDLDILKEIPGAFKQIGFATEVGTSCVSSDKIMSTIMEFWKILSDIAQLVVDKAHNNSNGNNFSSPSSTTSDPPKRTKPKRERSNTSNNKVKSFSQPASTSVQSTFSFGNMNPPIDLISPLPPLQPSSQGLLPTEGSLYVPLTERANFGYSEQHQQQPIVSSSYNMPSQLSTSISNEIPQNLSQQQSYMNNVQPPPFDTLDFLPDPNMIQSLFHMSSYPFSWDSDFVTFSGFNQSE